jgi:hypothetical protein
MKNGAWIQEIIMEVDGGSYLIIWREVSEPSILISDI